MFRLGNDIIRFWACTLMIFINYSDMWMVNSDLMPQSYFYFKLIYRQTDIKIKNWIMHLAFLFLKRAYVVEHFSVNPKEFSS